jgi:hypothetical protein
MWSSGRWSQGVRCLTACPGVGLVSTMATEVQPPACMYIIPSYTATLKVSHRLCGAGVSGIDVGEKGIDAPGPEREGLHRHVGARVGEVEARAGTGGVGRGPPPAEAAQVARRSHKRLGCEGEGGGVMIVMISIVYIVVTVVGIIVVVVAEWSPSSL